MKMHQSLFERELYVEDQEELMHNFEEFQANLEETKALSATEKLKAKGEESRLAGQYVKTNTTNVF